MERMIKAYGKLYAIENSLREYIEDEMMSRYGPNWKNQDPDMPFRQRPLNRSKFYELENYLRVYNFKIPHDFILKLRRLYPIRNKIAHCLELTDDEYKTLDNTYQIITDVISFNQITP